MSTKTTTVVDRLDSAKQQLLSLREATVKMYVEVGHQLEGFSRLQEELQSLSTAITSATSNSGTGTGGDPSPTEKHGD